MSFGGQLGIYGSVDGFGAGAGIQVGPVGVIEMNQEAELTVSDFEVSFNIGAVGPVGTGAGIKCDLLTTCTGFANGPSWGPGTSNEQRSRFGKVSKFGVQLPVGVELGLNHDALRAANERWVQRRWQSGIRR